MVASSTERVAPLRWPHACITQITPHLRVPSTSHQRRAPRSTVGARRRLVGGHQVVARGDAASGERRSEPPGPHAEPTQVLQRVAEVGQLPVEDGPQALGVDEEVAEAEVTVDDRAPGLLRPVGLQPARSPARRPGAARPARRAPPGTVRAGRSRASPVTAVEGDGVDLGHGLAHVASEALAGRGPLVVTEQLAGDRLAGQALDHHPGAAERRSVVHGHDLGYRHTVGSGHPQELGFDLDGDARARDLCAGPEALQDELPPRPVGDGIERPRLA